MDIKAMLKELPYRLGFKVHPSVYQKQKVETINSLVDFSQGKEYPKWPLELHLEVSNICDLKCAMCPTFSALNSKRFQNLSHADRGLINTDTATEKLEEILKHVLVVHAFGYGEPTLHPNFKEFIAYLSKFDVMVDFFSHGMHLTEEMCEFLVDHSVSKITISFSGTTAEHYENVYIGGDFERVTEGIKRLSAAKRKAKSIYPKIEVNSIAFKHHVEKFPDFVHLMGQLGVNVINLKPLQTYDLIKELHSHASTMDPKVEGELLEKAKAIAKIYGIHMASKPYEDTATLLSEGGNPAQLRHKGEKPLSVDDIPVEEIKAMANSSEKKEEQRSNKVGSRKTLSTALPVLGEVEYIHNTSIPCFEPFKTMYASFDGKVFPCCFKRNEYPLGSLDDSYADQIWEGELFDDLRLHILKSNEYPKKLCGGCIKASSYPKHHFVNYKVSQYAEWFHKRFDLPFDSRSRRKVFRMSEFSDIQSLWQSKLVNIEDNKQRKG